MRRVSYSIMVAVMEQINTLQLLTMQLLMIIPYQDVQKGCANQIPLFSIGFRLFKTYQTELVKVGGQFVVEGA
ncbi:hypothetical protein DBR09_18045 [Aeromonas sp. HMWF016]|nr:hypothetical protein DBR09_18045 [Aeromonas sp. HMWF016]